VVNKVYTLMKLHVNMFCGILKCLIQSFINIRAWVSSFLLAFFNFKHIIFYVKQNHSFSKCMKVHILKITRA